MKSISATAKSIYHVWALVDMDNTPCSVDFVGAFCHIPCGPWYCDNVKVICRLDSYGVIHCRQRIIYSLKPVRNLKNPYITILNIGRYKHLPLQLQGQVLHSLAFLLLLEVIQLVDRGDFKRYCYQESQSQKYEELGKYLRLRMHNPPLFYGFN